MKKVRGGFIFNTEDSTLLVTHTSEYGVSKIFRTKNDRFFTTFEPTDGEDELDFIPDGIDGVDELISEWELEEDKEGLVINLKEFQEG